MEESSAANDQVNDELLSSLVDDDVASSADSPLNNDSYASPASEPFKAAKRGSTRFEYDKEMTEQPVAASNLRERAPLGASS